MATLRAIGCSQFVSRVRHGIEARFDVTLAHSKLCTPYCPLESAVPDRHTQFTKMSTQGMVAALAAGR